VSMKKQILNMLICVACTFPNTPVFNFMWKKTFTLLPLVAIDYINILFLIL